LLAYEKTGYDTNDDSRMPDLTAGWSVRRLVAAGATAIKVLVYYNPNHPAQINAAKQAFVERVGSECRAEDVPFFLEPLGYDDTLGDPKGVAFAQARPALVKAYMAEFSKPEYGVDVLKVEVPVTMSCVAGTAAFKGTAAYSRAEALAIFQETASAAQKPFLYLSAGVSDEVFRETLQLAAEAGTPFSGVLWPGHLAGWNSDLCTPGVRCSGRLAGRSRGPKHHRTQPGDRPRGTPLVDGLRWPGCDRSDGCLMSQTQWRLQRRRNLFNAVGGMQSAACGNFLCSLTAADQRYRRDS
jgi:hypothetical protein